MKKNLFLTFLIVLDLLALNSYAFFYLTISRLNSATRDMGETLLLVQKKEVELINLKKILIEREAERAKIESYFVKKSNLTLFLERLEDLARQASVKLTLNSVDVVEGSAGGQMGELNLSYQATGDFTSLYNFLAATENLPLKLKIIKVDLTGTSEDSKKTGSTWNGSFNLKVLSFIND